PPIRAPYKSLNQCQRALLKKWMELGMPVTSRVQVKELKECLGGPDPGEKPILEMPLTYDTLKRRVLDRKCYHCHNPNSTSTANQVLFEPYDALVADPQHRW